MSLGLGLGISLWSNQAAVSGGSPPATTWDTSSLGAASFTFTNGNLTASSTTSPDHLIIGTAAKSSGSFAVTANAINGHIAIGLASPLVTSGTDFLGDSTHSIAYESDGKILKAGATLTTVATYAVADVITVSYAAGIATFQKNGTTVYTSSDISADLPTAFPAFGANLGSSQGTLNASGW